MEVVYHLSSLPKRHQLKLKVVVPRWKDGVKGELPVVPSVSSIWAIGNWHEREAYDLVGIHFEGIRTSAAFCALKTGKVMLCEKTMTSHWNTTAFEVVDPSPEEHCLGRRLAWSEQS